MRKYLLAALLAITYAGPALAIPFKFTFQTTFNNLVPPNAATGFLSTDLATLMVFADNGGNTTDNQVWNLADVVSDPMLTVTRGGGTLYSATYGAANQAFSALTDGASNLTAGTVFQDFTLAAHDNSDSPGGAENIAVQQGGLRISSYDGPILFASGTNTAELWTVERVAAPAPAPGVLLLLSAGLLGLGWSRRRTRL